MWKINYNKLETEQKISEIKAALTKYNSAENLNPEQTDNMLVLQNCLSALHNHLEGFKVDGPLTVPQNFVFGAPGGSSSTYAANRRGEIVPPGGNKSYQALFGNGGYSWPDRESNFFAAACSGRFHPGLIQNSMTETVPSDGGFLVPSETAAKIHSVSLEQELVAPRAFVYPMLSNEAHIPAAAIGSHLSHLYGGFVAAYVAEGGTIAENCPKLRDMTLSAKKLTGLIRFSSELQLDTPGGMTSIINICGSGLSWYRDKAWLKGTGAGEPLGILNAGCLVVVAKESGQTADTIQYTNLCKMLASLYAGSFANSVWVAHQSTIPQLLELSVAVGTGGSHVPVLNESNGQFTMLTRPVIFTEKTEKLGDQGDIMLCDFSQYVIGLKGEMRFDQSIHVGFTTDEILARLIQRNDGQPLWDTPLTLEDGTTQVSPFVTLAAR